MNLPGPRSFESALPHDRLFPRRAQSIGEARSFTREALTARAIQPARVDDMVLCVSELAANAVRHAVPKGRLFLVRLLTVDDMVRIEVHDSGAAWRKPRRMQATVNATAGRGLFLVGALSDEWGVLPRPPGKIVWVEFRK
ncbi:ATP-binding protein [Streptomyces goshikiensis]|uniref:ATP-binding protein n=1 Tax=Streptomyces goshikiensis TaxID=1942 RepID=UPI00368B4BF4